MSLKEKFDLRMYTQSATAARENIQEQYIPPDHVVDALENLHKYLIMPVAEYLPGDLTVTSGYRCHRLNAKVKGAPSSQHVKGMAADVEYREGGKEMNKKIIEAVKNLGLDYDQMINEHPDAAGNPAWVHLSYNIVGNRRQHFTIKKP